MVKGNDRRCGQIAPCRIGDGAQHGERNAVRPSYPSDGTGFKVDCRSPCSAEQCRLCGDRRRDGIAAQEQSHRDSADLFDQSRVAFVRGVLLDDPLRNQKKPRRQSRIKAARQTETDQPGRSQTDQAFRFRGSTFRRAATNADKPRHACKQARLGSQSRDKPDRHLTEMLSEG